jgi:hypothetical protein
VTVEPEAVTVEVAVQLDSAFEWDELVIETDDVFVFEWDELDIETDDVIVPEWDTLVDEVDNLVAFEWDELVDETDVNVAPEWDTLVCEIDDIVAPERQEDLVARVEVEFNAAPSTSPKKENTTKNMRKREACILRSRDCCEIEEM